MFVKGENALPELMKKEVSMVGFAMRKNEETEKLFKE